MSTIMPMNASDGAVISLNGKYRAYIFSAFIIVYLVIAPIGYSFFTQFADLFYLPITTRHHIFINVFCNELVFVAAYFLNGRLSSKLTRIFLLCCVFHGVFAIITLGFRTYYSIPIFFSSVLVSLWVGMGIVVVKHRSQKTLIAVIDSKYGSRAKLQLTGNATVVSEPSSDLTRYNLILLTRWEDVTDEWAPQLSKAMLAGRRVRFISEFREELNGETSVDDFHIDHLPEGRITSYTSSKRLLDVVLVLMMLPIALPLTMVAMLTILISMGRPIFYNHTRVGLGGRPFTMFKLRSMKVSHTDQAVIATAVNDSRITRVGAFLRRFRIDELPQLWNVLKGDMSLVGPRPEQSKLAADYEYIMPTFAYRNLVRPGITGWAQVRAGYAANEDETRVKLGFDLYYVKHMSFWLDLQILARTFGALANGGGVR